MPESCWLSYEVRGRKPSERLFRAALTALHEQGIERQRGAARRREHVSRTCYQPAVWACAPPCSPATRFAAGHAGQLKENTSRPDVLLTELSQIADVVG